ncbi:MAG: hypothetical protein AAB446_00795 [Patescibacteria group bacterium]
MSIKTKICLKVLVYQLIVLFLVVSVLLLIGPLEIAIGTVISGLLLTIIFVHTELSFDYPTWITHFIFARKTAAKYFHPIFGFYPPKKKDWLAMKVYQPIVSEKIKSLKKTRDTLFEQEDEQIQKISTSDNVEKLILEAKKFHVQVKVAKTACKEAQWLARFFDFNAW